MGNDYIQIVSAEEKNLFRYKQSKIWYRRFDPDEHEKIRKRHTIKKGIDRRTQQPKEEVDTKGIEDDLMDYLIVDWDGMQHPTLIDETTKKLKMLPCEREWKLKIPSSIKTAFINLADSESTSEDEEEEKKT